MKPIYKKRFKSGYKEDVGISVRSESEYVYALYLKQQLIDGEIVNWEYEPQEFIFPGKTRGCVSYLPDFKVWYEPDDYKWVEVKGFLDPKSKTKLKLFKKHYPAEFEKLKLLEQDFINHIKSKFKVRGVMK
jgi:hypothetical protein